MKVIRITVSGLPLFDTELDINFLTESRVTIDERHELIHLFKNFYLNRTLTFTGLNASGKTQILNILAFSLKLLQAEHINYRPTIEINSTLDFNVLNIGENDEVTITIYFYQDNKLYKLQSKIVREQDSATGLTKYKISSERLQIKKSVNIRAKKDIFDFTNSNVIEDAVRNDSDDLYLALSNDVSMIQIYYKQKKIDKIFYSDLLSYTNFNVISGFGNNIPKELVEFLDPSIEKIEFEKNVIQKDIRVIITFKNSSTSIILNSITDLNTVLSSGTVKGIGLFMHAMMTLAQGGIIIVDELENHFNREIAATLVRWFLDRNINQNNAILIYSTHYAELLDILERNDAIYITNKTNNIGIDRLSNVLKRNDIRRSAHFINGLLSNTTPSYSSENNLRKFMVSKFLTNEEDVKE